MTDIAVRPLQRDDATVDRLARILAEVVSAGGSVHFLHPVAIEEARAYWDEALAEADAGRRIV
ncbi:MAG: hypothetical protein JOZ27_00510, partial [Caulobacteraceae bacterium]|nr:hypothetical protein [Caulobacteraceae bacterium]